MKRDEFQVIAVKDTLENKIFGFGEFDKDVLIEPCFCVLAKHIKSIEKVKE